MIMIVNLQVIYRCKKTRNISIIGKAAFMNCAKLKRIEFGQEYVTSNNTAVIYINKSQEKLETI